MNPFSRRRFLQAAGLGACSTFLPSLARAQTQPPLRFVMVLTSLGSELKSFRMKPPGDPASVLDASSFDPRFDDTPDTQSWDIPLAGLSREDFSYALEPLYEQRSKLLAIDGLSLTTSALDPYGDAHARGYVAVTTGNPAAYQKTSQKSHASAPSIDQRIIAHLRSQDPSLTDLTGLNFRISEFGYDQATTNGFHYYLFAPDGSGGVQRVAVEQDPRAVFDRLFPPQVPDTDPFRRRRTDVLNHLSQRYSKMAPHLSKADRGKLDLHRTMLLDLQNRLERLGNLNCQIPLRSERTQPFPDPQTMYEENFSAFVDLTAASLSCGLSRVVTLELPTPPANLIGATPGQNYHHHYSHGSGPAAEFLPAGSPGRELWLDTQPVQANKMRHQAGQVAQLAARLDSIPDGDGTLLDNTIVLWVDEIATGAHGHDQWPAVIVGGGQALRTGRYLRLPRDVPSPWQQRFGKQFTGQPHTGLLVAIAQAMGLPIEHLGIPSQTGKVLAGPSAGMERSISLSGPLPGIRV